MRPPHLVVHHAESRGSSEADVPVERVLLGLRVLALLDGGELRHVDRLAIGHCGG